MKGRFAPSPTGHIHMGNIWIAFLAYASTRLQGGSFLIRMEDIDKQRSKKSLGEALLDDLEWLGFSWDEGPRVSISSEDYWQSNRDAYYDRVLQEWQNEEKIYPCFCNRARLHSIASAPHAGEHIPLYDGHCRQLNKEAVAKARLDKHPSYRLRIQDCSITYEDIWQGMQTTSLRAGLDDFVLKRADGMYAYNLAVVLDDAVMGVTEVIRGADLLSSTAQQIYLYQQLGIPFPKYGHAPLLMDREGHRLSKRQAAITVRELRSAGYSQGNIWKYLLRATGLYQGTDDIDLEEAIRLWCQGGLRTSILRQYSLIIPNTLENIV